MCKHGGYRVTNELNNNIYAYLTESLLKVHFLLYF